MDFTFSADQRGKMKESEKSDKFLDFSREKTVKHERGGDTNDSRRTRISFQRLWKKNRNRFGN